MLMDPKARLLAAGLPLLAARGIDGVNSNELARAAGVGVGTFYRYFPDKYALLHQLTLSAADALGQTLEHARSTASGAPGGPETEVRAVVEASVAFAEKQPELFSVAFGHQDRPGRRAGAALSTRGTERRLAELQRAGVVDPALSPSLAARGFAALQRNVLLWWLEDPSRATHSELVETLVRMHPALVAPR